MKQRILKKGTAMDSHRSDSHCNWLSNRPRTLALMGAIAALFLSAASARAAINLRMSPPQTLVAWDGGATTIVEIELYAETDQVADECFTSIELILDYDPAVLELLGNDPTGSAYSFILDGFFPDPDGINTSISDGTALYTAGGFGGTFSAPPAPGGLVTTFQFKVLSASPATVVDYLPSSGVFGETRVFNCPSGGQAAEDILGQVSTAEVRVIDCSAGGPDTDSDGFPDSCDNCDANSNSDQVDGDGDGAGDACDDCPADPNKTEPGVCGCGVPDIDTDSDGVLDCVDACPGFDDNLDCDNDTIPDGCEEDADMNGTPDDCEDCDSDGTPDDQEEDCNENGTPDDCEEFNDCNENATPDECEADTDTDGVIDDCDNCPDDPNSDQSDVDFDGKGDVCDSCVNRRLGDVNGDEFVNTDDIDLFVAVVLEPELFVGSDEYCAADCDENTVVDAQDIQPFMALLQP